MKLLKQLSSLLQDREQGAMASYADVVRAAAMEEDFPADQAAEILSTAGKTADDLEADAELYVKRHKWAADLELSQEVNAEMREVDAEYVQAEFELKEVVKPLRENLAKLDAKRQELRAQANSLNTSATQLQKHAPDWLTEAIKAAGQRGPDFGQRHQRARDRARGFSDNVQRLKEHVAQAKSHLIPEDRATDYSAKQSNQRRLVEIADLERRLELQQDELANAESKLAEFDSKRRNGSDLQRSLKAKLVEVWPVPDAA